MKLHKRKHKNEQIEQQQFGEPITKSDWSRQVKNTPWWRKRFCCRRCSAISPSNRWTDSRTWRCWENWCCVPNRASGSSWLRKHSNETYSSSTSIFFKLPSFAPFHTALWPWTLISGLYRGPSGRIRWMTDMGIHRDSLSTDFVFYFVFAVIHSHSVLVVPLCLSI